MEKKQMRDTSGVECYKKELTRKKESFHSSQLLPGLDREYQTVNRAFWFCVRHSDTKDVWLIEKLGRGMTSC